MKALFAWLLLLPAFAHATCDATIKDSDTLADFKAKLKCFADENATLTSENAKLEEKVAEIPRVQANFVVSDMDVDACLDKAVSVLIGRGAQVLERRNDRVDFHLNQMSVSIVCKVPQLPSDYVSFYTDDDKTIATVIVVSSDMKGNADMAELLGDQIFKN
jgi:hypothetical protein